MNTVKRTYLLGEEWLYYKIYCGVRSADAILANEINELTNILISKGMIDKWFFIRYKDPENHLRFRVQLTDTDKLGDVIQRFNTLFDPLLTNGMVWKVQTDIYNRELERYGTSTMEFSETLFFCQSELVVKLLKKELDDETYFIKVLQLINQFASCFRIGSDEYTSFLENTTKSFQSEFELDKRAKIDIDKKYRKLKPLIEKELEAGLPLNGDCKKVNDLIKKVVQLEKDNRLQVPLKSFMASHVHMLVNRAFRDKQRLFELLVYDNLWRVGKSAMKKEGQKTW